MSVESRLDDINERREKLKLPRLVWREHHKMVGPWLLLISLILVILMFVFLVIGLTNYMVALYFLTLCTFVLAAGFLVSEDPLRYETVLEVEKRISQKDTHDE